MIRSLRLQNFKSFRDATLELGPFTVLIGANATGKSNLRDAFRFLHGIGRGYTLAEIFGERWSEAGEKVWSGIRGGTKQAAYDGAARFGLTVTLDCEFGWEFEARYAIEVEVAAADGSPPAPDEKLSYRARDLFTGERGEWLDVLPMPLDKRSSRLGWSVLHRYMRDPSSSKREADLEATSGAVVALATVRFADFDAVALRRPSFPGQQQLGEQGENLSSVLQAIMGDPASAQDLVGWLAELVPGDVADLEFATDFEGRILAVLVEPSGRRTYATSASDGTLRYLGLLAALLQPDPPGFFFIEEIENGIHPSRLGLVVQLIEQVVRERGIQVVATTHSPVLLDHLSEESRRHVAVTYRLEGESDTRIKRLVDLPDAKRLMAERGPAELHADGWIETALAFAGPTETTEGAES